jgi:hypothetical protein
MYRTIVIGSERETVELQENQPAALPGFVRVRSMRGPASPVTYGAPDDDVVCISNIGGAAAVVSLSSDWVGSYASGGEKKVEIGETVYFHSHQLRSLSCTSSGAMSVLVIATGRKMTDRQAMEAMTAAAMQRAVTPHGN